ncbi:hypothetical protein J437_LFUL019203 [Ladona fulva]|uniref:Uncharacterized protein n=1 Tax=Ladona fulva TaxID=123851 RepID=A0A8K0KS96_LADFU|nr:hypothetical protein J437_LFUL019203 [Ladona fulva]
MQTGGLFVVSHRPTGDSLYHIGPSSRSQFAHVRCRFSTHRLELLRMAVILRYLKKREICRRYFPHSDTPKFIIIDDLMKEADGRVVDLFTRGSHHRNLSVIHLTQNLFHQGKGSRGISLNTYYIIYFKNPRDRSQIFHLSRQLHPEKSKLFHESYNDATEKPHGYLFIDLKQTTPGIYRYRTQIFPDDD